MDDRSRDSPLRSLLFTELYVLTMARAYEAEGMGKPAVFELFFRKRPPGRSQAWASPVAPFSWGDRERRPSGPRRMSREGMRSPNPQTAVAADARPTPYPRELATAGAGRIKWRALRAPPVTLR